MRMLWLAGNTGMLSCGAQARRGMVQCDRVFRACGADRCPASTGSSSCAPGLDRREPSMTLHKR